MTLNCKKEFSNKITNFKEYLEPIVEQCKIIIDNECKEIKKPLRRGFFINDLQIRYFVYNENNQLIGEYDNSFFNNSFSFK